MADPDDAVRAAAYFLMYPPTWVHRHVETYALEGISSARRTLTVDLVLPHDKRAMITAKGSPAQFCVPLVRMNKTEPVPFIELRDEQGGLVPLRTRAQNADTTMKALEHAIRLGAGLGKAPLPIGLHEVLEMLVYLERPRSDAGAVWAVEALAELPFAQPGVKARIEQVITHLILNSMVWVALRGAPGEHRVLSLAMSIGLDRPRLLARKPLPTTVDLSGLTIPWFEDGRISPKASLQAARAELTARMGWDSVDIKIRDARIQDPRSYHLQIAPERGLVVDRIEFDPDRETHHMSSIAPIVNQGHFYISDPALTLQRTIPIAVSIRVSRRGFLNVSALAGVLITALLWWYHADANLIDDKDDAATIAAAALLIVPPFLVVMSSQSEHELVTKLLSGVRIAVVACMVVAALAAAAIGGVRPTDDLATTMAIYASISSLGCAVIVIAWIGSFKTVRRVADAARCAWCGPADRRPWSWRLITLALVVLGAVAWHLDRTDAAADHPVWAAGVGALSLAILVSGLWPHREHVPAGVRMLAVLGAAAGAAWCAATVWPDALGGADTRQIAYISAFGLAAWALFTGLAVVLSPVRPRAPAGAAA
jgi:hypothetical protein